MKPIVIISILFIFCICFGIHLRFSLKKVAALQREKGRLEEVNRMIAKEIYRGWLFTITGTVTLGIWSLAIAIEAAPGVQNFWMSFSGLSLLVGITKLIGYYIIRKGP